MNKSFFSPGKIILTGEHSVVYGYPAVVSAISRGITAQVVDLVSKPKSDYLRHILNQFSEVFLVETEDLSIKIESSLPPKSGLGSSAAYAHAVIQAVAAEHGIRLSQEQLYDLVLAAEVFIHKNPSGIDPCAVVYGGTHSFIKDGNAMSCTKLQLPRIYSFLLINSGEAQETTGEMVATVAKKVAKSAVLRSHLETMGNISKTIREQLLDGSFTGDLFDANQNELESLGVVSQKAQKMIHRLTAAGAHAKITGAGGVNSGSGWILAASSDLDQLQAFCNAQAWENFIVEVQ